MGRDGRVMRIISETLEAHPARIFTYAELAGFAYPFAPEIGHAQLVAVGRAIRNLEVRKKVSVDAGGTYSGRPIEARRHSVPRALWSGRRM